MSQSHNAVSRPRRTSPHRRVAVLMFASVATALAGSMLPALAAAEPAPVAVRCDVFTDPWGYGMGGMPGMGMKVWAGTVIGHGADLAQAQSDAERLKWGPYGMAPELRNCGPVAG